jgi:photosystem II stability/assembly factor-like uncharacterized protein
LFVFSNTKILFMQKLLCLSLFCLFTVVLTAQPNKQVANTDSLLFAKQKYRLIGPWRGGRSAAVCGSYKQKNTFYFGATGGGVWKTGDGGSNWKNISDKYFGSSIGAVAVAPSDESILYVGEGENTMRGNVSEGFGIWRSDDGGKSWRHLGLKDTRHITRIIIHPKNPDIVWIAATGHLFGPNEERGVFKTTDGGKSWKKVLFANNMAGAVDLLMEPGNAQTLYATTWRVIRTPYSLESGGEGSALWKSTDGGETWKNISSNKGLPKNETLGIIGVAVSPVNTDRVWAIIEAKSGGLYRSDDGGATWSKQTDDANIRQRAWYFSKIFADPKNENTIYALNVGLYRSRDGGKTFQSINTPHGDHHDMWIDPEDPNRMIVADDGGAQVSYDAGANWSTYQNQPTAQFYRVSTDNHFPYRILGAQQDNTTVRILSRTQGAGITERDWEVTAGFESGYVIADPVNPDIVYGGNYGGFLGRLDHRTGENRAINVWPESPIGAGADVQKYRFQWNFPIFFSPHNPKRLYAAGNMLFVTENEGQSWEAISGDLTTNDKSKQAASGGPITKDNTTVEYYCTIFTAMESPLEKDLLWTGSDDGLIHVSRDGGKNWQNVTPAGCPKWMMWNCVEADPFKKGAAYFVGSMYKSDDYRPYIYKTEDYGKTWKLLTNGIASTHFTRALRADRKRAGLLYCGTEYGMYISYDDGANWRKFQLNLPIVPITDLAIKENDLIVATQGRAFWVLDDLSVVQQADAGISNKNMHVFGINDSWHMSGFQSSNLRNAGMNPPNGVVINYYLKDFKDGDALNITVMDKDKKVIRTFSTTAEKAADKFEAAAGMNQFVWNMQYPGVERVENMVIWNGNIESVKAPPGKYYFRFNTVKDSAVADATIKAPPVYKATQQDYEAQFNFLTSVKNKFEEVQKGVKNIRDLRQQMTELAARQGKNYPKEIKEYADSIGKLMTTIEETLHQTKAKSGQDVLNYPIRLNDKLSGLFDVANSSPGAPTRQVREAFAELSAKADEQLAKLKRIMDVDIPKLNEMIREKLVPVIGLKKE